MSLPQLPRVFIIILNWNGLEDTLECLKSVEQLDYPSSQIILVDNGSTDGSQARLKAVHPNLTVIEHRVNLGYTGGNNAAMQYALAHGADHVWLLNNDAVVEPDSLSKLVATARQDQNIGLISPLAYDYYDRDRIQFWGVLADMSRQVFTYAPDPREPQPGGSSPPVLLWGIALLVRSSVIKRIGYLDDRYFAYHEDLDYSLRAIEAGFRTLVEPAAVVYHKWSRSSGEGSPFKAFLSVRNLYLFWSTYLRGVPKYTCLPRYLAWVIQEATSFKETGNQLAADACLDGAWSAICGHYGSPRSAITMPRSMKNILYSHPHLWVWLLRGQVRTICHAVATRLRHRI